MIIPSHFFSGCLNVSEHRCKGLQILPCTPCDSSKGPNYVILQRSDLLAEPGKLRVVAFAYTQTIIVTTSPVLLFFCSLCSLAVSVFTYSECVALIYDNSQVGKCDEVLFMA